MIPPYPAELRRMQALAQHVTAREPALLNAEATVGELAWVWAKDVDLLGESWRHRLWEGDAGPAAFAWAHRPCRVPRGDGTFRERRAAGLTWQVRPDRPELLHEILDWYDEVAEGADRELVVQSADPAARHIAAAHGYRPDLEAGSDHGTWTQFNMRGLDDVPEPPVLPAGFRFLSAAEVPAAAALRAHHDAWPGSGLTATGFARVQRTWPYRAALHLLVAAPDGTLAATAILWLDEATTSAEFEPVGTHRDFRRRGLGTALQLHGLRAARAAGARRMFVACRGAPAFPAAWGMYRSVGFRPLTRDLPMVKTASPRPGPRGVAPPGPPEDAQPSG